MGSPRYCLAAERTERLVSINTVTLDWRMACRELERVSTKFGKTFALQHHLQLTTLIHLQQEINSQNKTEVILTSSDYREFPISRRPSEVAKVLEIKGRGEEHFILYPRESYGYLVGLLRTWLEARSGSS